MFKNKHVIVAMLVAPVLSILAWLAVDYFVGERPHAAKPGNAYLLVAKSNCRSDSGQCDLANRDFEITLRATRIGDARMTLEALSKFPLQQSTIGLVESGIEATPLPMDKMDAAALRWNATLSRPVSDEATLRVAMLAQGVTYYAEVPVTFLQLEY
ncbi:MAG: hypothetical protein WBM87_08910 [Woeseiaceae bacterium]